MSLPTVTAICCTYGRFSCVERVVNCYLAQTYPNKRLILYNTDVDSLYYHETWMDEHNISIYNVNIDRVTHLAYTNVGSIRRDALDLAGDEGYVITWDDDDIFLPHFMQQAIDRMNETGLPSFKPAKSFFYSGDFLRLVQNTMEASVIADIKKVKEYGYRLETGYEGLGWYTKLRDHKELDENDNYCVPSYCFNWNDGQKMKAPHKQSGDINNPNNFENHKSQSLDRVNGRLIQVWDKERMRETYQPYYDFFQIKATDFPHELILKYLPFIKV